MSSNSISGPPSRYVLPPSEFEEAENAEVAGIFHKEADAAEDDLYLDIFRGMDPRREVSHAEIDVLWERRSLDNQGEASVPADYLVLNYLAHDAEVLRDDLRVDRYVSLCAVQLFASHFHKCIKKWQKQEAQFFAQLQNQAIAECDSLSSSLYEVPLTQFETNRDVPKRFKGFHFDLEANRASINLMKNPDYYFQLKRHLFSSSQDNKRGFVIVSRHNYHYAFFEISPARAFLFDPHLSGIQVVNYEYVWKQVCSFAANQFIDFYYGALDIGP